MLTWVSKDHSNLWVYKKPARLTVREGIIILVRLIARVLKVDTLYQYHPSYWLAGKTHG